MTPVDFQALEILHLFGITSAVLSCFAYVPYVLDTIAGRTHPQRASWLIWSVLGSIALGSQIFEGAGPSLWFAAIQVGGTALIFLMSITRGNGTFLRRTDGFVLAAAGIGLVLWALTDTAVYALAITITISLLGGVVTVRKAYLFPHTETLAMWFTSFIAAGFAIAAVGAWNWVLLAYPLYLLVLNGAIVGAMLHGRTRVAPFGTVAAE